MKLLMFKINKNYPPSFGYKRKTKRKGYRKNFRPINFFFRPFFCNCYLYNKDKLKLIKFMLRRLSKVEPYYLTVYNNYGANYKLNSEKMYNIEHCSFLQLFVWINKSFWKKIMVHFDVTPIDYYWVRRRKINVTFSFFFDLLNKDINLDIVKRKGDSLEFFIVSDLVFIDEIKEIMLKYYKNF